MNLRAYIFLSVAALLLLTAGCQQNPTEPTATKASTISGTVFDAGNKPLALARVVDVGSLGQVDTSKTDGSFKLLLQLTSNYNTSLYAILPGYVSDTPKVSLTPGDNLTGINIHMRIVDSSKIVGGSSGRAANIGLLNQTSMSILLKGGINQSCTLTFLVVDSLNRPVTSSNKCKVKFTLSVTNPSGESIQPDTGQTDPLTGQVSTTVFSGTKPNAILVTAQVIDPTRKIVATAGLTEGTGLPDGNHVTIGTTQFNIAGRMFYGLTTTIVMRVNDQFGNHVVDGTPVSFVTNGGGITKDAFTKDGVASATLTSGGGNPPTGGLVTVTAEVKGDTSIRKADSSIVRTIQILFSGHTTVTRGMNTINFEVPDGDANYFDFTVSDDNGMPLVAGSTITVSVDANSDALKNSLRLTGNQITMPDTKDTAATHFRVWVYDKIKDSLSGVITFKINITSQNGNYPIIDQDWFSGYMRGATAGTGFFGVPASITLADSSSRKLYLSETQLPDTSTLIKFIVRDGSGTPISANRKTLVTFSLLQAPSGTYIIPNQDSTGAGGAVTVTVCAGNVPGITKVVAKTTDGLGNYFSAISMPIEIAHGLPDSNQIFLSLEKNMFNNMGNQVGTLKINLADVNGNFPAPIYLQFNTTGGVISPISALSDANGSASTGLYGGKVPVDPVIGFGNVTVFVKAHGGVTVKRKAPFVFSGAPIITPLNVHATDTITIADGSYMDLYYTVADINRIPLAQGNTITVSVSGPATNGIILSNAVNTTTGTSDTNSATYSVRINDATPGGGVSGNFDITISVSGPNGTATKTLKGFLGATLSGYSSSIQLLAGSPSATTISVKGTGATETSTMSFVVKDSLGNPVNSARQATVTFSIVGGPGGGEFLSPASALTDAYGKVTTTVNAGTKAGVMQVVATTTLNGITITSAPVPLTIASGFADLAHFTVWTDKINWQGWVSQGIAIGTVSVQMGDMYANPVQPNTAVYFTSTGGIITSSAFTDATGHASATVYGGNPFPSGGIDIITASTLGKSGTISGTVRTVYSGTPIITVAGSMNLGTINSGNSITVNYKVADLNNNPLASGNIITVTASVPPTSQLLLTDLLLKGDVSVTMPDTKDTNSTNLKFTIINGIAAGGTGGNFIITITSSGPNGTISKTLIGSLQASTSSAPTQIVLSSISSSLIAARGTGGLSTADVIFQGLDAGGRPIDITQRDTVFFTLSDTSGGSYFIPTWALTDAGGKATTKLYAGINYGSPTITARMKAIVSQPVPVRISGPSWTNFNVTISANNLPGLSQIGTAVGKLTAQIGDTLGNPVLIGTNIKFTTSGGMIDASAMTDINGSASANISGGATPNEPTLGGIGWGYVTALTQGNSGTTLQKRIPFLFSGAPIITTLNVPSSDTIIIFDSGYMDLDYKIADGNGNPLAAGNAVLVTVTGADAGEVSLGNYYSFTTNGTTDINQTSFRVRLSDRSPAAGTGGNFDVSITVSGPNGNTIRRFHGLMLAPGAIITTAPKQPDHFTFATSATDIFIGGTGGLETATITYQVLDAYGSPIASSPSYVANFSINFFPNSTIGGGTYPTVTPTTDSTNSQGQLHASVASGTQAGVVEIVAQIVLGSGKIVSSNPVRITVHAGFPDQKHFSLIPYRYVFPPVISNNTIDYPKILVAVGDTFSNPVPKGTAVYLHSQAGIIQTGNQDPLKAYTDDNGLILVNLITLNPLPYPVITGGSGPQYYDPITLSGRPGGFWVSAQTQARAGKWIWDSCLVILNQGPITTTGFPAGITMPHFGSSAFYNITVKDFNGNPLCDGTSISASITLPSGVTGLAFDVSGSFSITHPATIPYAAYARFPGNGITDFTFSVIDLSSSEPTTAFQVGLAVTITSPGFETLTISIPVTIQ